MRSAVAVFSFPAHAHGSFPQPEAPMPQPFVPALNFHALNLQDLLEAREAYHVHLSHLDNVIATAVGRYRIRMSEIEASGEKDAARLKPTHAKAAPRTLANSKVLPESWP